MSNKNPYALMDLIRYRIRAIENGYWLEALALTHLFVETQLRLILSGISGQSGKSIPKSKIENQKYVMQLANLAKDNRIVNNATWQMIKNFNRARNEAIHGLSSGQITYDDLREPAVNAGDLISQLQRYYVTVNIGPEIKIEN